MPACQNLSNFPWLSQKGHICTCTVGGCLKSPFILNRFSKSQLLFGLSFTDNCLNQTSAEHCLLFWQAWRRNISIYCIVICQSFAVRLKGNKAYFSPASEPSRWQVKFSNLSTDGASSNLEFKFYVFLNEFGPREVSVVDHAVHFFVRLLTRGIEYFDSFKAFCSRQKLQQALKSWANFTKVLFGKEQKLVRLTFKDLCKIFKKSMKQLWQIHMTT